jgi:hypothetical protein
MFSLFKIRRSYLVGNCPHDLFTNTKNEMERSIAMNAVPPRVDPKMTLPKISRGFKPLFKFLDKTDPHAFALAAGCPELLRRRYCKRRRVFL